MTLEQTFRSLSPPSPRPDEYAAELIPGWSSYRIAKDAEGRPAILVKLKDDEAAPPDIVLRNLSVRHRVRAVVQGAGNERFQASIITCTSTDSQLQSYFLRHIHGILDQAGPTPSSKVLGTAVLQLVELFSLIEEPARISAQGLWAELLLIAESNDPVRLLKAWHSTPYDRYDFTEGHEHLEVKSCRGPERIHHFSQEQLETPPESDVLVASMVVQPAGGSATVAELAEEIRRLDGVTHELKRKLDRVVAESLGAAWKESNLAFDRTTGASSVRYYRAASVPRLAPPFPSGVTDVRFRSDLKASKSADPTVIGAEGGLFRVLPTPAM